MLVSMSTACVRRGNDNEESNLEPTDKNNESESIVSEDQEAYLIKLEKIASQIIDNNGESVQRILNKAYASHRDVVENIYYADHTGKLILSPPLKLPEDYDARKRPWYKNALDKELYKPMPYQDQTVEKSIQTIAKALYKEDELLGVLAMDYELAGDSDEAMKKKVLLSVEESN